MSLTTSAINQWGLPLLDDPGPLGTMVLARREAGMDTGTALPDQVTPTTWLRWLAAVRRGEADIISSPVPSLGRRAHVFLRDAPGESAVTNDAVRRRQNCVDDYLVAEIAWEAIHGRASGISAPPMPSDYGADLDRISARAGFPVSPPVRGTE